MYKIGTDIVQISRIEKSIKSQSFLDEVFTKQELEYCKRAENYAGIFAAKEAYFKAIGTGITRPVRKVEILHTGNGKPYIFGDENSDVSISHDGDFAIAVVIKW